MRANRRVDTTPELALRRELHASGLRYFVDHPITGLDVRVRPDVVFPRLRIAVFVDGCFWHACPTHGTMPRANHGFWAGKLSANRARDARVNLALHTAGWIVVRAWEHEDSRRVAARVRRAVARRAGDAVHKGRRGPAEE